MLEIGWGPGCGVGSPGDGLINVNSSGGLPRLLFPLKPPPGPPTPQPGTQPISKIMTLARLFRTLEYLTEPPSKSVDKYEEQIVKHPSKILFEILLEGLLTPLIFYQSVYHNSAPSSRIWTKIAGISST